MKPRQPIYPTVPHPSETMPGDDIISNFRMNEMNTMLL